MSTAFIISLLVIGIILILLEIFVMAGFGIAGIAGIASLVAGCFFSFEWGTRTGIIVTAAVVVTIIILVVFALRSKTWERLALKTNVESSAGQDSSAVSVGDKGKTSTRLAPMGSARINGMTMEVKSEKGFLDADTAVTVTRIENNIIYVTPEDN